MSYSFLLFANRYGKDLGNVEKVIIKKEKLWTKEYIIALIIMFGVSITMNMIFSTIAVYGKGLTGSDVFAGLLASMFTIAALASRGVMGVIFSLLSLKAVLLLGMAISLLASVGYLYFDSEVALIACRVLHGIGFGVASTAGATVLSRSLPKSRMLEGVGYSGLAGTVAMALGPSIALSICNSDWLLFDRVFLLNLCLTVVVLICAIFVKIKNTPPDTAKESDEEVKIDAGKLLGIIVVIFAVLSFTVAFLQSSVSALLSVCALERSMGNISAFFTFYACASFASRLVMPKLVETFSEKIVLQCSIAALCICLITIAISDSAILWFVLSIPYGFASGMIGPIFLVRILNEVSYSKQGNANALYYATIDGGIGLGALVWSGIAGMAGYMFVYLIAGILAFISLVAYTVLNRKYVN